MVTREKIREGIARTICFWHIGKVGMWEAGEYSMIWEGPLKKNYYEAADMVMMDEASQDVVIKVDKDDYDFDFDTTNLLGKIIIVCVPKGLVAVEPLIEPITNQETG